MKTFKSMLLEQQLDEMARNTIGGALLDKFAKALRVSPRDAKDFIFGGGGNTPSDKVMAAAEKMGYKDGSDSYDKFWQKIYTHVEYSVLMHMAAGGSVDTNDRLL
jgi:hypothetical protein